jgi:hypothetical protein
VAKGNVTFKGLWFGRWYTSWAIVADKGSEGLTLSRWTI